MNRTSRTEEPWEEDGLNQSPNPLSNDLTTNQDFNGVVNSRQLKDAEQTLSQHDPPPDILQRSNHEPSLSRQGTTRAPTNASGIGQPLGEEPSQVSLPPHPRSQGSTIRSEIQDRSALQRLKNAVIKFGSFIGPGFMIAVAYSKNSTRCVVTLNEDCWP